MAAVLRHPFRHIGQLARRWAYRRQGRDRAPLRLHRRRIYILPTRLGLGLAVIIAGMILAAINYANSLGFALAFTLAGLALVSMHHAHRQLTGLILRPGPPGQGFVGEAQALPLILESDDRLDRHDLLLIDEAGEARDCLELPAMSSGSLSLPVTPVRRGPFRVHRYGLESRYPLGLFRAWCWLDLPLDGLAWPQPIESPPRHAPDPEDEAGREEQAGAEDFSSLRGYERGDPVQRMLWRHYLSRGELIIKQFSSPSGESAVWFDWESAGGGDIETRLGRLCHWLLQAESEDRNWGLRLPGQEIGPGRGRQQAREALDQLARFGYDEQEVNVAEGARHD